MEDQLKVGQEIFIPELCPNTELRFGKIKGDKLYLLGCRNVIRRIEGDRITTNDGWYFHKNDLIQIKPFEKTPIQSFDPEKLTV